MFYSDILKIISNQFIVVYIHRWSTCEKINNKTCKTIIIIRRKTMNIKLFALKHHTLIEYDQYHRLFKNKNDDHKIKFVLFNLKGQWFKLRAWRLHLLRYHLWLLEACIRCISSIIIFDCDIMTINTACFVILSNHIDDVNEHDQLITAFLFTD